MRRVGAVARGIATTSSYSPRPSRGPDAHDGHRWDADGRDAALRRYRGARWPQFLPDGRHFLFFVVRAAANAGRVHWNARRREPTPILAASDRGRVCAAWSAAVGAGRVLVAQRFDPVAPWSVDEPIPVAQAVGSDVGLLRGAFAVSATGVLAASSRRGERRQLAWVDREANRAGHRRAARLGSARQSRAGARWQRVAVDRTVRGNQDVWLIDMRALSTRFTFGASTDALPSVVPRRGARGVRVPANGPSVLFGKRRVALATSSPCL
jgi:hypothetical protein